MSEVENKAAEAPTRKKNLPLWIALGVVAVAAIVAAVILLGNGGKSDDAWLREALANEGTDTIELNEDIKATEGYEVNGNKTIVGSGKISMTTESNYVFSVNEGASLTVDGITVNVMNVGANGVVVRSGGRLEWKSGMLSYPKQYAIISYGDTLISGGNFEYAGANWLYVKSGTKAAVTGGHFMKSTAVGFEVEKDAELSISGKDTLIERAGTNTINNYGKVTVKDATISASEVWTITNHGELTMDGATVKDCSVKGVLYNYKDAVSASITNCTFSGSKTYHVYNQHEVTIKDTDMSDSGASSLNNQPGATMNVENVTLTNCGYHAIYNDRGTMNIVNCDIDTTVYKGVQNKTGYVTIDGMTLNNVGGAGLGNVAYVTGGGYGYIHANNVTATNTVDYNVVSYGGDVKLSNSVFNETPGTNVYIRNGTFELDSIQILGTKNPGKVTLALGSDTYRTVEGSIKGDTVIKGSASRGVTNYGTLYLYGGTITGNRPSGTSKAGGGIYTLGDVYMYGGSITGNSAVTYGGGIRVDSDEKSTANLYMYGGSISNNYAGSNGGGISIADPVCGLYFYGGTVSGNVSDSKGDGILINGEFELYDDACIRNNDIYIFGEGQFIDVKSTTLSGDALVVRHGALSDGTVVAKFPSEAAAAALAEYFVSGNDQFTFEADGKNLVARVVMKDLVSPVDFSDAPETQVTTFAQLKSAVENTSGKRIIKVAADIPMTSTINVPASAAVKLIDDGTARTLIRSGHKGELFHLNNEAKLYVAGTAGLTLDGASATIQAEKPLVFVTANAYVVLESGAVLQNNTNTSYVTSACAGAVNLYGGRMIVDGGVIRNCNGPTYETADSKMTNRPAVYVSTTGVLSVKAGEISGNLNGAIRSYGRVYVSGGEIKDNVRSGDGGAAIRAPWIHMTGGVISGNASTNGGGAVYLTPSEAMPEGYFYMNGGTITANRSGVNDADPNYDFDTVGGAVYVDQNCVFDCVAGIISNNQGLGDKTGGNIGQNGGGIVNDGTVYLRSGAVVSGNYATRNGGGIFCRNKGAQLIIEGAIISDNYTDGRGGAIFTEGADNIVTITGATIENNKAVGAGGILFGGGEGSVSDTVFRGNVAERTTTQYGNAGAIMNQSGTKLTLTNVTFDGNKAIAKDGGGGCGGAIYNGKADLVINGVVGKNNEARVADDIFFSEDTLSNTINGAFDVTEIYLEGEEMLTIGENFTGRADNALILVDLPTGSSTNRYLSGEKILDGKMNESVAAMFTLGEAYPQLSISANGYLLAEGGSEPDEPDVPVLPEGPVAQIGEQKYNSLAEAVAAAQTGDTIVIINDVVLTETLAIDKGITITTDGVADRTITGTPSGSNYYINVTGDAPVMIKGAGETSRLIIDGENKEHDRALICLQVADSKLEYVTLKNNISTYSTGGGALYINKAGITLDHCVIESNTSNGGGAVYMTAAGSATLSDCRILNNRSTKYGGAFQLAANSAGKYAVLTLNNCVVEGNMAADVGGAAYMSQSSSQYPATLIAENTTFKNNTSATKGAVIRATGAFQLTGCTFEGNTAVDGDISEGNGTAYTRTITNCTFDKTEELAIAKNDPTQIVVTDSTFASGEEEPDEPEDPVDPEITYVAMIGQTGYESLAAAVAAAQTGETIVIIDDVVLDETLIVDKSLNIVTDGEADRTITSKVASGFSIRLDGVAGPQSDQISLKGTEGAKLIIKGLGKDGGATDNRVLLSQNATTTLEYVVIENGYASSSGGGLYVTKGSSTLNNCVIANNVSGGGGAVYLTGTGSATLNNCQLIDNLSTKHGGAIQGATSSVITLNNCLVKGNEAQNGVGGAAYLAQGSGKFAALVANNTVFESNKATENGDAIRVNGSIAIDGCTFTGNSGSDGDISEGNGNAYARTITNCTFDKTEAAAIAKNDPTQIVVTDCTFAPGEEEPEITYVAKIGEIGYESLAAAVVAAQAGETVVITDDVVLSETLAVDKTITIATDGEAERTISADAAVTGNLIQITADGVKLENLIVDGGSIERESLIKIECANTSDIVSMEKVTVRNALSKVNGGAVSVIKGKLAATDCVFDKNEVDAKAEKSGSGGAIYLDATNSAADLIDCTFTGNKANYRGGAIYASKEVPLELTGCVFDGNEAGNAGGAILSGKTDGQLITDCTFTNNVSGAFGGAVGFSAGASMLTLDGCIFTGNTANGTQNYAGGAISVGTALAVTGGETSIIGNAAPNGFGGAIGTQKATGTANVTVEAGAKLNIYGNTQKSGGEVSFKAVDGEITGDGTVITAPPAYVAKIGEIGYESLAAAVAAAQAGETVVIVDDVVLDETLTVDKAITITTDGVADRTVTGIPSADNYYINIKADAAVAIKGTAASRLVIDGENVTHDRGLVAVQTADSVLEYVVLQHNINGNTENLGGALYVNKTGVVLNNCVLQGNQSGGGGAVYATGKAGLTLNDCQILNNTSAKYGGAFQGAGGSVITLNNCQVKSNTAADVGGAAYMAQSSGKPAVIVASNTVFESNSTVKTGGVIRATGGFQLTGCTFTGNSGSDGDISEGNSSAYTRTIANCTFDKTEPAAIAKKDPTQVVVTDCTFAAE